VDRDNKLRSPTRRELNGVLIPHPHRVGRRTGIESLLCNIDVQPSFDKGQHLPSEDDASFGLRDL
jgi:hypothetical protein